MPLESILGSLGKNPQNVIVGSMDIKATNLLHNTVYKVQYLKRYIKAAREKLCLILHGVVNNFTN
jgi:hypothetical protein